MPEPKIIAGVMLKDNEGRYLFVQESNIKIRGLWGFTGGHADPGETAKQAAIREALEETGFQVAITDDQPILVFRPQAHTDHEYHAFKAEIIGGHLAIEPGEILDAKWLSLEEVEELDKTGKLRDPVFKQIILKTLGNHENPRH
jgi:8-oxo-dGTP pyrophosphatase MutT (NUDIX family)